MAKSVAKNALYSGIRTVSTMLFPLITYPYVTRVLMADNLGKVDFSISIVSYFTLIAGLGITNYATREGARVRTDREKLDRFSSEVFTINLASTLLSYLLLAIVFVLWPHLHGYGLLIAIQSAMLLGTTIGVEWLYTLSEDFGYITARAIAVQVVSAVLLFTLVKTPDDYVTYACIIVFSGAGANVFNFIRARRYATIRLVWDFDPRKHLVHMLILFGNALAASIYINIDVTFLSVMRGDYEVGLYSFSVKIYKLVKQLLNAIVLVSVPRLSFYLGHNDRESYDALLNSILHALFASVLPALLLLFLLSDYVVLIAGGEGFVPAAESLRLLCLSLAPAVFVTFAANGVLLTNRAEHFILRSTIVGAVLNFLLNLLIIPYFGASGASVTTLVAEGSVLATAIWLGRPFCDYRALFKNQIHSCVTTALGLAAMTVAHLVVQHLMGFSLLTFFVSGFCSVLSYSAVLLLRRDSLALQGVRILKNRLPLPTR